MTESLSIESSCSNQMSTSVPESTAGRISILSKSPGDIIDFLARRLEPLAKVETHLLALENKILAANIEDLTVEQAITRYEDLSRIVLRHVELLSRVMQKEDVEAYMKGLGVIDIYLKLKSLPVSSLEKVLRFVEDGIKS